MSEAQIDLNWLCKWLEENSSGVYRPAKDAAFVIRDLLQKLKTAEFTLKQTQECLLCERNRLESVMERADKAEASRQIRSTHKWCNKCGYTGLYAVHENCGYEAIPQKPVVEVVEREVCRHDDDGYLVSRSKTKRLSVDIHTLPLGPLYTEAPKSAPIEVTDELLIDLYDHSHDDEWVSQDVSTEALRRIVQRALKGIGLEVKS